jgi:nucleoside diphosphate kinase
MVATENLTSLIAESVKKAQNQSITFEEIYDNPTTKVGSNEFLFFIKPEILVKSDKIQLDKILELIEMKIEAFGFNIHNIKILSANYLDQYNIIAQHYGVINKISSNALANISDGAKEKFKELTGKSISEVKVLGGSEFIEQYPNFNAYSLDYLWQNLENKKLAGGTYFEPIKVDDEIIYVINGFHPRQLKHFTEAGRSIVVMTLSSDVSWTDARSNFIGATNPNNANIGSLRREFLDNKENLGLAEVSQGVNGVHLSAGPVEALIELKRYNSNFADNSKIKDFSDYSFGKTLQDSFNGQFDDIVNNINILIDDKATSIFDLTEEKNSDEAVELLKQFIN